MSLIEEALRRVKDPLLANTETGTAPPATPASQSAPQPKTPSAPPEPSPAHPWSTSLPAPRPAAPVAAPASTMSPTLSFTAVIVLLCTILFLVGGGRWIAGTLGSSASSKKARATPAAPRASSPASAATPAAPAPAQQPTADAPEGIALTGVVEGLGEPYAVINGQIVGVHESIGEWTVLAVADGTVTLRNERGEETVLRVTR